VRLSRPSGSSKMRTRCAEVQAALLQWCYRCVAASLGVLLPDEARVPIPCCPVLCTGTTGQLVSHSFLRVAVRCGIFRECAFPPCR